MAELANWQDTLISLYKQEKDCHATNGVAQRAGSTRSMDRLAYQLSRWGHAFLHSGAISLLERLSCNEVWVLCRGASISGYIYTSGFFVSQNDIILQDPKSCQTPKGTGI